MNRHPRRQLPVGVLFLAGTTVLLLTWIGVEFTRDPTPEETVAIAAHVTEATFDVEDPDLPSEARLFGKIGVVIALTAAGGALLWIGYNRG